MEEDFGGGYLGKGEGNFLGGLVLGGKGNGWKFFGRVGRGTLMGIIILGEGWRTWGELFGGELCWESAWSDETKREKKRDRGGGALY